MKTHDDPILDEIRAFRRAYAARFNYDIDAIFEDIRAGQNASGREIVRRPRRLAAPEENPNPGEQPQR